MSTFSNTAREVEMPNGDIVKLHDAVTPNSTSNIKKFKYDDNGHVTESEAANATDLNLNSYSTPTSGSTDIGTSDAVQTAIGKLDHQSHIDQTNILYAINTGVKNSFADLLGLDGTVTADSNGLKVTLVENGGWHVYGTMHSQVSTDLSILGSYSTYDVIYTRPTDELYIASAKTTGTVPSGAQIHFFNKSPEVDNVVELPLNETYLNRNTYTWIMVRIPATTSGNIDFYIYPMIRHHSISNNTYQPCALPNSDLTQLEAEDRAALAEVVDSGAKNVWNFPDASYESRNSLTVTDNSDGSKTFTAENGNWQRATYKVNVPTTGRYCLAFSVKNSSLPSSECYIFATPNNSSSNNRYASIQITGNGNYTTEFNVTGDLYIWVYLNYGAGTEQNSITLYDVMLCTKAAFGVSPKFVPYQTIPKVILNSRTAFTSSTTMTYTGVSYTIPAHTAVRITANLLNSHGTPVEAAIASYANQNIYLAYNEMPTDRTIGVNTVSFMYATTDSGYTVAVLAKFSNATENYVHLVVEKLS